MKPSHDAENANDELRKLFLSKLTDVKSLMISHRSVEIIRWLKNNPRTSANLALISNISISNASTKLKQLHVKGYLERIEFKSPSGGIEYRYQAKSSLFDDL